jgi:hypothetical protein
MDTFERFCSEFLPTTESKNDQALGFLWFHVRSTGQDEATAEDISTLFSVASLARPNSSRLKDFLRRSREVLRGNTPLTYRPSRDSAANLDARFGHLLQALPDPKITDRANVRAAPLLSDADIDSAQRMAELYIILHCYENSARRVIESVLSRTLGPTWWNLASNTSMQKKVHDRQDKESKNKWIAPRGPSPLYYIDWGDLVTLIRKHETEFASTIGDLKFIELRMEELERLRNIVAHHGVLESDDDYQRIILSFRDWCKQVSP